MNVTIRCSVCKKRWPYAGGDPAKALDEHHAKEHPERDRVASLPTPVEREPGSDDE